MRDELERWANLHGSKTAIAMADGSGSYSFSELDERANAICEIIRSAGLHEGEAIGLLTENDIQTVAWWWGGRRAGVYFVPIATRLLAREIDYIVNDSRMRLLVASPAYMDLAAQVTRETNIAVCSSHAVPDASAGPLQREAASLVGREIIYSSGTTGRPKGVRRALVKVGEAALPELEVRMRQIYGYDEDTVYLSASPLYHATGRFLTRVLEAGGTVVILPRFDPLDALQAIEQHKVTHSQWVPTMFRRLLDLPKAVRGRFDLSSLKVALHAAAPCPTAVKQAMIDWWGPIVHEYYGGTENAGVTYIEAREWLEHPGSVGRSISGAIHILDQENPERELPPGELGLITFEGGVPFQYTLPGGKLADNASPQGYTGYGDIGSVDEDGYLYISDRRDDLIISGGVNIYPREVEAALEPCAAIAEVAVIGLPHADFGQLVCAVVVPAEDVDGDIRKIVSDYARTVLSPLKIPREVFVAQDLPRNETGKLLKRVLRDHYAKQRDEPVGGTRFDR
ncbi:MAG: AMP-binding protein [Blastomonas sp.]